MVDETSRTGCHQLGPVLFKACSCASAPCYHDALLTQAFAMDAFCLRRHENVPCFTGNNRGTVISLRPLSSARKEIPHAPRTLATVPRFARSTRGRRDAGSS